MNCKIHPLLYHYYVQLHETLSVEMVHRRKRENTMCIEIIFGCEEFMVVTGRLNSLPEAEKCGYWVICRPQTKRGHTLYKGHRVFQLFLSPVHPKKRRETQRTITPLSSVSTMAMIA